MVDVSVENRALYQERRAMEGDQNWLPVWRVHRCSVLVTSTSVATGSMMAQKPSAVLSGHPVAGEAETAIQFLAADNATQMRIVVTIGRSK